MKYKGRNKLIKQWKKDKKLRKNNPPKKYLEKSKTGISEVKLDFLKAPKKYGEGNKKPEKMKLEI